VLLSNPEVAGFIRENLIASWEMVRQVPKVTIDFRDGNRLERTLKGNTVLFLCAPDGTILDAWPGVAMPDQFLAQLQESLAEAGRRGIDPSAPVTGDSADRLKDWHRDRWEASMASSHLTNALRISTSKAAIEGPLLSALGTNRLNRPPVDPVPAAARERTRLRDSFQRYTSMLADASDFPTDGKALRVAEDASGGALSAEEAGARILERDAMEYHTRVRPAVWLWLAGAEGKVTPADARDHIFERVLLVPIKDPFLGLDDVALPGTPRGNGHSGG
jgi:hypothetical protein